MPTDCHYRSGRAASHRPSAFRPVIAQPARQACVLRCCQSLTLATGSPLRAMTRETGAVDLLSIGTLVTATMSAVAAIGSWRAAYRYASVDEERHRAELRPQLALRIAASQDDSRTAVMYVTLTGPADLPTPGKILLTMMDMPTELRDEVLAIYAVGGFTLSRGGTGAPKVWGPWEFMGGLKPGPFQFAYSTRRSWAWGFRFCRPTRWLPSFRVIREEAAPKSKRRRRRLTATSFDGVLFYLAWFVGQRTRVMRGVRLNEVQVVRNAAGFRCLTGCG